MFMDVRTFERVPRFLRVDIIYIVANKLISQIKPVIIQLCHLPVRSVVTS